MKQLFKHKTDILILITGIVPLLSNCGPQKDNVFSCPNIKEDQRGSFMVSIHTPETIQVHVDTQFSPEEFKLISKAASQWNTFSQTALNRPFFNIQTISEKKLLTSALTSKDACAFPSGDESSFQILKENSMTRWKDLGFKENTPGVTLRCNTNDQLIKQVILINPNPTISDSKQFMSIVLHELGHSLGLNHSCSENKDSKNYRFCEDLNPEHPYKAAIMFPILGHSETKEILMSNDKERASCLYQEQD